MTKNALALKTFATSLHGMKVIAKGCWGLFNAVLHAEALDAPVCPCNTYYYPRILTSPTLYQLHSKQPKGFYLLLQRELVYPLKTIIFEGCGQIWETLERQYPYKRVTTEGHWSLSL